MAALRIRLQAQLRSRWRAWLVLSVLIGLLGGVVIGAAAGAKRTHGSYGRYLASIHGADVYVDPFVTMRGDSIPLDRVAALPQVAQSERSLQLAMLSRSRAGRPVFPVGPDSIGWVLPTDNRRFDAIDRLKLLGGRLPDPTRPNEVIGDTRALAILGVHVGDSVVVRNVRQRLVDHGTVHLRADPLTTPYGRLIKLRVVGVAANARADVDGGQMHLTPAFLRAYGGRSLGAFIEELVIRLERGQADLPAFKRALARVAGKRPFLLFEPSTGHPKIQHSIDLQARALWLIAALAAIAGVVISGQALLRLASDESSEDSTLRALGADGRHQLGFALARATLIAVPAVLLAGVIAFLSSALAPIGWARQLEPRRGLQFDAPVLVAGMATVLFLVIAFAVIGAVRALLVGDVHRTSTAAAGDTRISSRVIHWRGSPAFAAGVRMAVGPGDGRAARGTLTAAVIAVVVCVTALTFAASFHHLTTTPRLYGQTWDYETFPGPAPDPKRVAALLRDRGLPDVARGTDDIVSVNGIDTGVRAWDDLKGSIVPTVTAGRAPRLPNEIGLATKTLDAVHARVGDYVNVGSGDQARRLHVVGRIVLPSSKENKLGYGGVLTFTALSRIDRTAQPSLLLFDLADGAAGVKARARLDWQFDSNVVIRPDEVGDFGRINNMPLYIALLAVGAAGAALAHALATRVRRGRHELAVLKTLGFTRPQVAAAVAWEATTIVAIAATIGLPLGIAVGRFTWHLFAADLGVAPEVDLPLLPIVLVVPITLVLANVLAALPGWLAARIPPARVLRTE